ncbi:MAG TPA: peptidoglycan editing factor PgeF [Spirochaetota bacterium]|nr:peptidoglycan editing factor PgeF [Spirochaetota bacterium]
MMHLDFEKKDSNCLLVKQQNDKFLIGVAAKNCNTVNYELDFAKIRKYEKYCIHFETGTTPENIYFINQQHEDNCVDIRTAADISLPYFADADAMITGQKGACLVIRTADCVPVLIADTSGKCIGAIHSGWRGTEKNVTAKTISCICDSYGSKIEDLRAYILPSIGVESYQVDEEVASIFPDSSKKMNDSWHLDLRHAVVKQLLDMGIHSNNIFASPYDTFSSNELFFSHRKGDKGRNLNFITLK